MIGILGAMPEEVATLRSAMTDIETQTWLNRDYYRGMLYGQSVVLVQGGIGKVRATITATTLVCQFPLSAIVFTGVAAALRRGLQMGDVILSNRAIEHDFGMGRDPEFTLGLDFLPGEEARTLEADRSLLTLVEQVQSQVQLAPLHSHTPQIYQGLVASGDTFVASDRVRQRIYNLTQADVVEMEGAAVLRVAEDSGLPCLLIRSVSDEGDSDMFQDFLHTAAQNSAALVKAILAAIPPSDGQRR